MFSNNDSPLDSSSSTGNFVLGPELKSRLSVLQAEQLVNRGSRSDVLLHNDAILLTIRPGVALFLRFDGKIVIWDFDGLWGAACEPRVTDDLEIMALGLVFGARELQLPELRELLPARPENGSDCGQCGPERIFYNSSVDPDQWTVCPFCKGLGWTVDPILY